LILDPRIEQSIAGLQSVVRTTMFPTYHGTPQQSAYKQSGLEVEQITDITGTVRMWSQIEY